MPVLLSARPLKSIRSAWFLLPPWLCSSTGSPPRLRHQQVRRQIAIEIAGDQRARIMQLQLVEPERCTDIFKALRALVAEDANFGALRGLDHGSEVDPAVVVEVDGGDAPAFRRVGNGQRHALELRCHRRCATG